MRILAIETSCDETAVAVVEATLDGADGSAARFRVLGDALQTQIAVHAPYGGVFPAVAKREHARNLVPVLAAVLAAARLPVVDSPLPPQPQIVCEVTELLAREPGLADALFDFLNDSRRPALDAIAVTAGPGLEPALWVGVNFAKALALLWDLPIVSVNHMEGHICAALTDAYTVEAKTDGTTTPTLTIPEVALPLLSLLISGGHTELVLSKAWGSYELVGATRDDAVGEAFDKVARMLGLPYPGGPAVSALAERARASGRTNPVLLPRPMLTTDDCDFSFSGLKTAVLYLVKDRTLTDIDKEDVAWAFEDAVTEVLYAKTVRALEKSGAQTLALGGGVSANTHIRREFTRRLGEEYPRVRLAIPTAALTTDNAVMIGLAGAYRAHAGEFADLEVLVAEGGRKLRA